MDAWSHTFAHSPDNSRYRLRFLSISLSAMLSMALSVSLDRQEGEADPALVVTKSVEPAHLRSGERRMTGLCRTRREAVMDSSRVPGEWARRPLSHWG